MPHHRQGGKFTGSHTTVTDTAAIVVDAAARDPGVSKISLGLIQSKKNKKRHIKAQEMTGGWKITVCGNTSIQTVYVYTSTPQETRQVLERLRL